MGRRDGGGVGGGGRDTIQVQYSTIPYIPQFNTFWSESPFLLINKKILLPKPMVSLLVIKHSFKFSPFLFLPFSSSFFFIFPLSPIFSFSFFLISCFLPQGWGSIFPDEVWREEGFFQRVIFRQCFFPFKLV
jgi:hypothetical protein